jgi:hypothetical protein
VSSEADSQFESYFIVLSILGKSNRIQMLEMTYSLTTFTLILSSMTFLRLSSSWGFISSQTITYVVFDRHIGGGDFSDG